MKTSKALFSATLMTVMVLGFMHLTAEPAQALTCASTLPGVPECTFSHIQVMNWIDNSPPPPGSTGCCMYNCPGGFLFRDICGYI